MDHDNVVGDYSYVHLFGEEESSYTTTTLKSAITTVTATTKEETSEVEGCMSIVEFERSVTSNYIAWQRFIPVSGTTTTNATMTANFYQHYIATYMFPYFLAVCVASLTVVYVFKKRRKNYPTNGMRRVRSVGQGFDRMEVLRSTRARSSTVDFFGANKNSSHHEIIQNREGNESTDTPFDYRFDRIESCGSVTEFRRERMGSMDLFYSTTQQPRIKKRSQTTRRTEVPIPAQLSSHNGEVDDSDEGFLFDEFGLVTMSYHVEYYGPSHKTILYSTWTPPTSWAEASRRIIPQDIMTKLKRKITLNLSSGKVLIHAPKSNSKWDSTFDAENVSIRIVPPVEAGVINLYVKGSPRKEWLEHTFESARAAAQFQLDLTSYQVLGPAVKNLFNALNLVHRGSIAFAGPEYVLHDDERKRSQKSEENGNDENESSSSLYRMGDCVAWDDAMRSMSSIPTIRIALERLWLNHPLGPNYDSKLIKKERPVPSASEVPRNEEGLLTDEYVNKRLLLGQLDFFRLFVPELPEMSFPQSESSRPRMEQLLSWRKRAARAAVLVQSYVASHRVVNSGWKIPYPPLQNGGAAKKLNRRLAFDVGDDNNRRDRSSRNEYYEASVSRDVLCHVRPFDYFENKEPASGAANRLFKWSSLQQRRLVLSPYQAYSLVGVKVFKSPDETDSEHHKLHPARDPVEVFPSLSELIAKNPHLDFFVMSFFHKSSVSVFCYVRSLPKGIDPQFDNVVSINAIDTIQGTRCSDLLIEFPLFSLPRKIHRFRMGTKDYRDKRVNLMVQLGHNFELSFIGWAILRLLSVLFNLTSKGRESPLVMEATRDRTPFPAVRLSNYSETYHFGGGLQTNEKLPGNYVSLTSSFQAQFCPNQISRLLFSTLEGQFSVQTLDMTLVIEGKTEDELVRFWVCVLSSQRDSVFSRLIAAAITISYNFFQPQPERAMCTARIVNVDTMSVAQGLPPDDLASDCESLVENAAAKTFDQIEQRTFGGEIVERAEMDRMDIAIREVLELLDGVQVPVRRMSRSGYDVSNFATHSPSNLKAVVPVLSVFNQHHDIGRFILSCNFDLKEASLRLVETTAWRGKTYPIDTRKCRIELQNGQFFQQGIDRHNNPVFYFRNMCLGPWRNKPDCVISSVLYRLDSSLSHFCQTNPNTKCTVVILMGRPCAKIETPSNGASPGSEEEMHSTSDDDEKELMCSSKTPFDNDVSADTCNPRVDMEERWHRHTDRELVSTICSLLAAHYPERLSKALVVRGNGSNSYFTTRLQGRTAMKQMIGSLSIRKKVTFVKNASELTRWIDIDEIVDFCGGNAVPNPHIYDI